MEMLSAVVLVNQGLEAGHLQQFSSSLVSLSAGLSDVDPALLDRYRLLPIYLPMMSLLIMTSLMMMSLSYRYFETLVGVKQQVGRDLLTWNQLQEGIAAVNGSAQDEQQRTTTR